MGKQDHDSAMGYSDDVIAGFVTAGVSPFDVKSAARLERLDVPLDKELMDLGLDDGRWMLLICGAPGSGKTSRVLRWMARLFEKEVERYGTCTGQGEVRYITEAELVRELKSDDELMSRLVGCMTLIIDEAGLCIDPQGRLLLGELMRERHRGAPFTRTVLVSTKEPVDLFPDFYDEATWSRLREAGGLIYTGSKDFRTPYRLARDNSSADEQ